MNICWMSLWAGLRKRTRLTAQLEEVFYPKSHNKPPLTLNSNDVNPLSVLTDSLALWDFLSLNSLHH